MRCKTLLASTSLVSALAWLTLASAQAQNAAALTGRVSSAEEAVMEGVLVSAKKDGATITTTVVSNDKGQFSFPADRLEPGHYNITIRAAGYVLVGPKTIDVAPGAAATADIKLAKTNNVAAQLSNTEWLQSVPGDDRTKSFLPDCVNCHTLQRVFTSPHSVDEWKNVFGRMATYSPLSVPARPQPIVTGGPRSIRPRVPAALLQTAAEFIYSVNLSNPDHEEYGLKRLPRPHGRATRVIITEYDLPRKEALPHDVVVDPDGHAWYSDFGAQFVGELDPKTGKVTDYPLPVVREEQPKGSLNLELDPDSNLWVGMAYQAGVSKIDRKTKAVTAYPLPKEWAGITTQTNMASAQHMDVDGKVWTGDSEAQALYRLDVKSGQWESMGKATDAERQDHRGLRQAGRQGQQRLSARVRQYPHRQGGRQDQRRPDLGDPDACGRARAAAASTTRAVSGSANTPATPSACSIPPPSRSRNGKLPTAWSAPYDVAPTKTGDEVWTGSMLTDQVERLFPATDEIVEYLLPHSTNIRRVFVQDTAARPVLWFGNNHGAAIIRVEPLD